MIESMTTPPAPGRGIKAPAVALAASGRGQSHGGQFKAVNDRKRSNAKRLAIVNCQTRTRWQSLAMQVFDNADGERRRAAASAPTMPARATNLSGKYI